MLLLKSFRKDVFREEHDINFVVFFPKNLHQEADTLHLELIRFLFERACQPYIVFIRSWLYLATVQDPFGEFFVKALPSTGLKKRPGQTLEQDVLLSYEVRFLSLRFS
jgi:hypothetical protein